MHANWRLHNDSCPKVNGDFVELSEGRCGDCRFMRGASSMAGQPYKVLCNWPVNGSEVEEPFDAERWNEMMGASTQTPYGYLDAIAIGLNDLHLSHLAVRSLNTVTCSELVAECLFRADYDIKEDPAVTSPGDLAELLGIER